jgi:hypothetical protein
MPDNTVIDTILKWKHLFRLQGMWSQIPVAPPNKGWLIAIKVGIGSMSEDLNRIFSPFEQVKIP